MRLWFDKSLTRERGSGERGREGRGWANILGETTPFDSIEFGGTRTQDRVRGGDIKLFGICCGTAAVAAVAVALGADSALWMGQRFFSLGF